MVAPEKKSIFAGSAFEFGAGRKRIVRVGFSVEGYQPISQQRRIIYRDRPRMSTRSRIPGLVADRVNLLRLRFQELQTELPCSISEPPGGEVRSDHHGVVGVNGQRGELATLASSSAPKTIE